MAGIASWSPWADRLPTRKRRGGARRTADAIASGYHGQHQVRRKRRRAIDALGRLDEIRRRRLIDAGHEFLWIAIDQREPGRLHLDHQAVPLEDHVIVRSWSKGVLTKVSTSGRPSTNRWSWTSQVSQSPPGYVGEMGRGRYGTGFAGSETYSRYALPPARGRSKDRVPSACRYRFVG